jgi:hypothetical protein
MILVTLAAFGLLGAFVGIIALLKWTRPLQQRLADRTVDALGYWISDKL